MYRAGAGESAFCSFCDTASRYVSGDKTGKLFSAGHATANLFGKAVRPDDATSRLMGMTRDSVAVGGK